MFEKKIEKNTIPHRISHKIDPAKCGIEQLIIELAMLNFRLFDATFSGINFM